MGKEAKRNEKQATQETRGAEAAASKPAPRGVEVKSGKPGERPEGVRLPAATWRVTPADSGLGPLDVMLREGHGPWRLADETRDMRLWRRAVATEMQATQAKPGARAKRPVTWRVVI